MRRMEYLPPWALALRFMDAINGNEIERLGSIMSDDHTLRVFTEDPVTGRQQNIEAWRGYCSSWPDYIIYPRRMAEVDGTVAIVGHTTGSHLELPDDEESQMTLIWLCRCADGEVTAWELIEDTPESRATWALA
jgi:ketosteroid isomerase-like protein